MHIVPVTPQFAKLLRGERLFVESCVNLTHERSLDSFRVRCHNGRTILEELQHEILLSIASGDDLAMIAAEARDVCSTDAVLSHLLTSPVVLREDATEYQTGGFPQP